MSLHPELTISTICRLPYDEDEPLQDSAAHSEPSMDLDAMLDQPKQPEPDAAAVMAEKRRRRAEIMAKYASQDASPLPPPSPIKRPKLDASDTELNQPGANTPEDHKTHPETSAFDLAKHEGEHVQQPDMKSQQDQTNAQNEISAASYNPDEDRKQDALRQLMHQRVDESTTHGQAAVNTTEEAHAGQESEIEIEVTDDEDQQQQDGGEEEEDDMFALATEEAKPEKVKKTKKIRVKKSHGAAEKVQASGMVVRSDPND